MLCRYPRYILHFLVALLAKSLGCVDIIKMFLEEMYVIF
jgi:hypothetical protein